jgi:hypothetical protein
MDVFIPFTVCISNRVSLAGCNIVWAPGEVKAAIVTCGGLCPGLNSVICELVKMLYFNYGVDEACSS